MGPKFNRAPVVLPGFADEVFDHRCQVVRPIHERLAVIREGKRDEPARGPRADAADRHTILQRPARGRGQHEGVVAVGAFQSVEPFGGVKDGCTGMTIEKRGPAGVGERVEGVDDGRHD